MEGKETYLYFAEDEGANAAGDAVVYPASKFRGIDPIDATHSRISFESTSGDNLDDDINMVHASGKYKELCQAMATLMNSDKNDLVVVFDEDNLITHPLLSSLGVNPAAGLDITLDTLLLRLTAQDLREMNILKYYRLTRKWACKTYGILDADLELLFYLDCEKRFTRKDFIDGTYTFSWDKARWDRLRQDGWIDVWRHRNRTTIKYSVYSTSYRCKQLINRIYRILLGEEDLPTSERSKFYKNKSYTDKVYNKAIDDMIKDKNR